MGEHIEQWLEALPLNAPVAIDGETVYLQTGGSGSELGLYLLRDAAPARIEAMARAGFQSARQFGAGLALREDGRTLVLNRWLPGVSGWSEAAGALEDILNQVTLWRALAAASNTASNTAGRRDERLSAQEQRMRARFAGGVR